jgi:hypothetical protein
MLGGLVLIRVISMRFLSIANIVLLSAAVAGAVGCGSSEPTGVGDATDNVAPLSEATAVIASANDAELTPYVPPEPTPPEGGWVLPATPDPQLPYIDEYEPTRPEPSPPELLVRNAAIIVSGRIVEVMPSQWNTFDQRRPSNPWSAVPFEATIITPVVIELDGSVIIDNVSLGLEPGTQLTFAASGGQVEKDRIRDLTIPPYTVGKTMLLILVERTGDVGGEWNNAMPEGIGTVWAPMLTYELTPDGNARSYAGDESASELIASLLEAASAVATPAGQPAPSATSEATQTP